VKPGSLPSFPSIILTIPLDPQPRTKDDDEEEYEKDDHDDDDENETPHKPSSTTPPLHHSTSRFGRSLTLPRHHSTTPRRGSDGASTLPRHRSISPSLHHSTLCDLRAMLSPIRVVLALKPRYPRKFFR
jgi:hypothetical protein